MTASGRDSKASASSRFANCASASSAAASSAAGCSTCSSASATRSRIATASASASRRSRCAISPSLAAPRAAGIPITDRPLELVSDPEVDVVVEVAGGTEVGPVLTAALAAGKPVVTANKTLLASQLAELGVLAQRTATPLYCEAAAAAALPILRHLSHRADEVDSLAGILNGTCNFILTRMEQELPQAEAARRSAAARTDRSESRRRPLGPRRRGQAVDPRVPRVRRLAAARRIPGPRHRVDRAARLRSGRSHGLPHPADRARGAARSARSTWRSSRCCCPRGTCSRRSKRNTTRSI